MLSLLIILILALYQCLLSLHLSFAMVLRSWDMKHNLLCGLGFKSMTRRAI